MSNSILFRSIVKITIFLTLLSILIIGKTMHKEKMYQHEIIIGFGGDTMLGRLVNKIITTEDFSYPWGNLLPYLKKPDLTPDLTIVNLENTFTKSIKKVPKVFNFKADPGKVETLKIACIDCVNLANNHILDFDIEGMQETITTLNNAGIKHSGAGMNIEEACKPAILTKKGITIGVIGCTDNEPGWAATTTKPGINYIEVGDIDTIKKIIAKVRDTVDLLIISIHWGPNMKERPSQEFIEFAHQMIDSGVDIIHGHSAHIFQGIEIYKNKLIMYDTGDLVDDYKVNPILHNDRSFFYLVSISKTEDKVGIRKIQLIPTLISKMQVNLATGTDYKESLNRIQKLSDPFGTAINNEGIIKVAS